MKQIGTRDFLRDFRTHDEPLQVMNHLVTVGYWYPASAMPEGVKPPTDLLAGLSERKLPAKTKPG